MTGSRFARRCGFTQIEVLVALAGVAHVIAAVIPETAMTFAVCRSRRLRPRNAPGAPPHLRGKLIERAGIRPGECRNAVLIARIVGARFV
jgi:hypothetical protein